MSNLLTDMNESNNKTTSLETLSSDQDVDILAKGASKSGMLAKKKPRKSSRDTRKWGNQPQSFRRRIILKAKNSVEQSNFNKTNFSQSKDEIHEKNSNDKKLIFSIKKIPKKMMEDVIIIDGKCFYCCIPCSKKYTAYPALYAHRRNKHNIITIKKTERIFKNALRENENLKFNYNSIKEVFKFGKKLCSTLIEITIENLKFVYKSRDSCLYNPDMQIDQHTFIQYLDKYQKIFSNETNLQEFIANKMKDIDENFSIDDIFIIYFVGLCKVIERNRDTIYILNRFLILFHEYLNLVGWDLLRLYKNFQIENYSVKCGYEFTQHNFISYIPDFINDFISVFLSIPDFQANNNMDAYKDFSINFCNYLYNNKLTNLKIIDKISKS